MIAPAANPPISPAPPSPYLSLGQAADAINQSQSMARRLCRDRWGKQGHARKEDGRWIVHPEADERLQSPSQRLEKCMRRDREQAAAMHEDGARRVDLELAFRRRKIVLLFEDCRACGNVGRVFALANAEAVANGLIPAPGISKLSKSTLYKWARGYREHGIRALVPRYTERGRKPAPVGEKAWKLFSTLMLCDDSMSVAEAYTLASDRIDRKHKGEPDWEWPGLKTIERRARDAFATRDGGRHGQDGGATT